MNNQDPDSVASQAKKYWDNRGEYKEAGERLYPDYHEIRLGKIKALIDSIDGDDLNVVDVGCGEGGLMAHCLDKGWNTSGFDISEKMVEESRTTVTEHGGDPSRVNQGGVERLEEYDDNEIDLLLAVNVLTYFTDDEDQRFYQEAQRIVKPDGVLIVSHSNEMFDIFTMNRYTSEFFESEIIPLTIDDPDDQETAAENVRSLLTYPDRPEPDSKFSSQRDDLHKRRENPISYPKKLSEFGFSQTDLLFTHYHALPPLLFEENKSYAELGKQLETSMSDNPLHYMMASIFISKSVRTKSNN